LRVALHALFGDLHREPGRDFAGFVAAHAVADDHEQRAIRQPGLPRAVFVVGPNPADVGMDRGGQLESVALADFSRHATPPRGAARSGRRTAEIRGGESRARREARNAWSERTSQEPRSTRAVSTYLEVAGTGRQVPTPRESIRSPPGCADPLPRLSTCG